VAAKGGGAWKVAYADFVTAMMAFFLVMWICGQDQKIRKAVSDYFGDPLAVRQGISKTPYRAGSLFDDALRTGTVPQAESVAMGKGRSSFSSRGPHDRMTKLINDWLHADEERLKYWQEEAKALRQSITAASADAKHAATAKEMAILQLAQRMREEIGRDIPTEAKGIYEEILNDALGNINWKEIAEDLLAD